MPTILRKRPFFETHTTALVAGSGVTVRPYQIIVWIHKNQAGRRDVFAERPPGQMESLVPARKRVVQCRNALCVYDHGRTKTLELRADCSEREHVIR